MAQVHIIIKACSLYLQRTIFGEPFPILQVLFRYHCEVLRFVSRVIEVVLLIAPECLVCDMSLVVAVQCDENLADVVFMVPTWRRSCTVLIVLLV